MLPTPSASKEREVAGFPEYTPRALLEFVFPKEIKSTGKTEALSYRDEGYALKTLSDVYRYNLKASHLIPGTAHTFELQANPIESPWWSAIRSPEGAREFIEGLVAAMDRMPEGPPPPSHFNVLEKAMLQRDLVQIYALLAEADQAAGLGAEAQVSEIRAALADQIKIVALTAEEYRTLEALRPRVVPANYSTVPTFSLRSDYLPTRVLSSDSTWVEVPHAGQAFRHFLDYGGRSFIRVYLRARQLDSRGLIALWTELYRTHGADLHVTGTPRDVPLGFEAMLVRSFGVFVSDGGFRDSSWPEEVIIRAFKYSTPKLDIQTSDFRGTIFYQYRMDRSELLRDPQSLGLRRVHDDDEQFFGFFGDVPDPTNSYSDTTTTMRANCISCHSELYYGLSTIFSLERDPENKAGLRELSSRRKGGFDVNMRALQSLRMFLNSPRDGDLPTFKDAAASSSIGLPPNRGQHDIP